MGGSKGQGAVRGSKGQYATMRPLKCQPLPQSQTNLMGGGGDGGGGNAEGGGGDGGGEGGGGEGGGGEGGGGDGGGEGGGGEALWAVRVRFAPCRARKT